MCTPCVLCCACLIVDLLQVLHTFLHPIAAFTGGFGVSLQSVQDLMTGMPMS